MRKLVKPVDIFHQVEFIAMNWRKSYFNATQFQIVNLYSGILDEVIYFSKHLKIILCQFSFIKQNYTRTVANIKDEGLH